MNVHKNNKKIMFQALTFYVPYVCYKFSHDGRIGKPHNVVFVLPPFLNFLFFPCLLKGEWHEIFKDIWMSTMLNVYLLWCTSDDFKIFYCLVIFYLKISWHCPLIYIETILVGDWAFSLATCFWCVIY